MACFDTQALQKLVKPVFLEEMYTSSFWLILIHYFTNSITTHSYNMLIPVPSVLIYYTGYVTGA